MTSRDESSGRSAAVASHFSRPELYLRSRFNISIRAETVREMVGDMIPSSILDLGCGDGSLSLQFLKDGASLTLVDLSEAMLSIVRERIPPEFADRVRCIRHDVTNVSFPSTRFDVVLCVGVLAHLESVEGAVSVIVNHLKDGGRAIIQLSDASHPLGKLRALQYAVRSRIVPGSYKLNWPRKEDLVRLFGAQGLSLRAEYAYNLPPPFLGRFLDDDALYRRIRRRYGSLQNNTCTWMASERILCFAR